MQQKVVKALDKCYPKDMNTNQKIEIGEIAYNALILYMFDAILRKINDCKITKEL